jgi:hypothetical protein
MPAGKGKMNPYYTRFCEFPKIEESTRLLPFSSCLRSFSGTFFTGAFVYDLYYQLLLLFRQASWIYITVKKRVEGLADSPGVPEINAGIL